MARPRSVPDQDLLDAALAVIHRSGPEGITFAAVAAETGLSASTLVQRFGSKQALMRAALLRAWDLLDARTAACDADAPISPAGAVEMLVALSADMGPGDFADSLLVLREDLRDPALRRRGAEWGDLLAEALGRRLAAKADPRPLLGRQMAAQWQGVLLWWGFSRRRPIREEVAESLHAWCAAMGFDIQPSSPNG